MSLLQHIIHDHSNTDAGKPVRSHLLKLCSVGVVFALMTGGESLVSVWRPMRSGTAWLSFYSSLLFFVKPFLLFILRLALRLPFYSFPGLQTRRVYAEKERARDVDRC